MTNDKSNPSEPSDDDVELLELIAANDIDCMTASLVSAMKKAFRIGHGRARTSAPAADGDTVQVTEVFRIAADRSAILEQVLVEAPRVTPKTPTFNHTRADSPLDPCPECLQLMSRAQLLALIAALREP